MLQVILRVASFSVCVASPRIFLNTEASSEDWWFLSMGDRSGVLLDRFSLFWTENKTRLKLVLK